MSYCRIFALLAVAGSVLAGLLRAEDPLNDQLILLTAKLDRFVRITTEKVEMEHRSATLCSGADLTTPPPTPGHREMLRKPQAMIHVYITPDGERTMREPPPYRHPPNPAVVLLEQVKPATPAEKPVARFPVGTIILKEKFSSSATKTPELYTGMRKRSAGYNPDCGDWEFFVMTGDRKAITARGRIESCMDCHQRYPRSDFVTKVYLEP